MPVPVSLQRALTSLLAATVLATGLAATTTTSAQAATDPSFNIVDRPGDTVTADALPTVQIDGVVWDQAIAGDTVYAGGQFANARPAGAAPGTNQTPRGNLLSYNLRTGVLNTGFAPTVNGRIRAMALSPDKSRLYVVGAFTAVNGQSRSRVAAFNAATGALISGFAPVMSSDVFSVVATNTTVYLGGWFGSANGVPRTRLAAVNASNGATTGWAPVADSTVNTMTLAPDSSRVILGGIFANVNGSPAEGLASVDASNGTLYPFAANTTIRNHGNTAGTYALHTSGNYVYGATYWFGGTGNFEGMFQADPYTGEIRSMADCHGDTYDVSPMRSVIYVVSHHHDCSNMNGFPDTNPRNRWKRSTGFTIDPTTTTGPNTAGGYYDFSGQPAPSLVNWFPDVAVGSYTGQYQGGWTTESTDEYLVQGGEFPYVNNIGQQGLVRFAIPSIANKKQGPRESAAASAPTLQGISGNSVRVTWPSNWDRDDMTLTYKLYRSDRPTTPLVTQSRPAQFWNLPKQRFTDTGLTPNTTYGYWVTATDPDGNTLKSSTTTITTGTTVVDNSAYSQAVVNDGAEHYWRLNEPAGATSSIDSASGNDLTLGSGVTTGATGAIVDSPDTAASFDGSANGTSGQDSTEPGPNVFTAEAWIKTASTSGGKILGFGDSQLGQSSNYDRHVYMDNTGHLTFGVYPGGVRTVTTSATYNDGAYHYVVATLSGEGMRLYVDGVLQGTDATTTFGQAYPGYWRVGGDNLGGWPNAGSSSNFTGIIDDVAIYPTALTAAQVSDHYSASGASGNAAPEAAFSVAKTNLKVDVDGSGSSDSDGTIAGYAWTYGDGATGSGVTDSHTYAAAGTFQVKLTVTDNQGATNSLTKSVTVTAAPVPNQDPTAAFSVTKTDLKVDVDGSASSDPDGTLASYAWTYGDGATGTGVTDSHTYAAAGTFQVKLTVTDNQGATDTLTKSVTVTAAPATNVVARDTFARTGRWGTAEVGGAWTDSGASYFATNGSKGVITIPRAGSGPSASLNAVAVKNSTTTLELTPQKIATGSGTYLNLASRKVGDSQYLFKVRLMPDGSVRLNTAVVSNGAETLLKSSTISGLTYAAGDTLKVRFGISGTGTATLSGKVWKATATEPGAAQITSTDSTTGLQTAGAVSIKGYLSGSSTNSPADLSIDNYLVVSN